MENLEIMQKNSLHHEISGISEQYVKSYIKSIILITIVSFLSALIVYFLIFIFKTNFQSVSYAQSMTNEVTNLVFIVALISYAILCIALTNAVILFSLSQPRMVTKPIIRALAINALVGFLLTRWMSGYFIEKYPDLLVANSGYAYAVFGVLAGSIMFAIETTFCVLRVMKDLDYYIYYAS